MSTITRLSTEPYRTSIDLIPIEDAVLQAKTLPKAYLDGEHYDVSDAFTQWLRPLVGDDLGSFISFLNT